MIAIRAEIDECPDVLRNAPHTAAMVTADEWPHAVLAGAGRLPGRRRSRRTKYWPPVRRIDGGYGDRNLVCACLPPMRGVLRDVT